VDPPHFKCTTENYKRMQREGIKQKLKKKESATAKNAPQQKEQT
jgi:hypothetical protein